MLTMNIPDFINESEMKFNQKTSLNSLTRVVTKIEKKFQNQMTEMSHEVIPDLNVSIKEYTNSEQFSNEMINYTQY